MATIETQQATPRPIFPEGLYRWSEFANRIPYSRETWRLRVKEGRAPRPVLVDEGRTAWRGADILQWLQDPVGYKAPAEERNH